MHLENDFEKFIEKLPKKDSFNFILRFIMNYVGCAFGGIRILNENGFIPYEHFVGFSQEFCESESWLSLQRDHCVCIRVISGLFETQDLKHITENGSFYLNNSEEFLRGLNEKEKTNYRGRCVDCGFRSLAIIPLHNEEKIIGAIHLADCENNKIELEKILELERMTPLIIETFKAASNTAFQTNIVQNIKQSVIVLDANSRVLFWNEQSDDLFGWLGHEVSGKALDSFGLLESCQDILDNSMETDDFWSLERLCNKKNGEKIWVQISLSRLRDSHGFSIGFILICHDITEQKVTLQEIKRLEQLHLVGQIAAGMAHEIRNSMTTVRGFLQLFSSQENLYPEKENYDLMIHELDRANGIISDFLSLAKDRVINVKMENLNYIISDVSRLIQANAIKSDKEIIFELEELPDLFLDRNEIKKLILNIVQNGLEAMSPGSILYLKTYLKDKEVVLEVKDSGSGIPQEVIDKIGQPFITTKENGIGLGLSECFSICARHQAKIDFRTNADGTTFFIRFSTNPNKLQISLSA